MNLTAEHTGSDPPGTLEFRSGSDRPAQVAVLSEKFETFIVEISDADLPPSGERHVTQVPVRSPTRFTCSEIHLHENKTFLIAV